MNKFHDCVNRSLKNHHKEYFPCPWKKEMQNMWKKRTCFFYEFEYQFELD